MRYVPYLLLATILSYPCGVALGQSWLLPILNAAPAYLIMARLLSQEDRKQAVLMMLLWAATLALSGTATFTLWPRDAAEVVIRGTEYREEMLHWIRTGEGSEGSPRLFLPQQLLELAAFVALSLATASIVSIVMGAILMNYMSLYVASLARQGAPAWAVILLGWQPWTLCRLAAFCTLGVILAEPVLSRLLGLRYSGATPARRYLTWAGAGILADWALKAALAPMWGGWLRAVLP